MDGNEEIVEKARGVKLLVLDVDGVLTDGSIIYTAEGVELKAFNVKDGHGVKLLKRSGVDSAIVTARSSPVVERRAEDLGIEIILQGMKDKLEALEIITSRTGLDPGSMGYVGDDLVDLPFLRRVRFSACPSDAVHEVRQIADHVCTQPGGRGAVREVTELILRARGAWDEVFARYTR